MWKGNTVHDAIAFLLKLRLQNKEINFGKFKQVVVERLRNQFRESRSKQFRNDPKNKFGLLEHEYGGTIEDETWRSNRNDIIESINNFQDSDFWELANSLKFEDCLALEGDLNNPENIWTSINTDLTTFLHLPYEPSVDYFFIDDLKVWVKLDFGYRKEDGNVRIVDWKSSQSEKEPDPMQLNVYGYYASEEWEIPEEKIQLTVYNVARQEQFDRGFSRQLKHQAHEQILESAGEMKTFLTNPQENKADEEDFPKITRDNICRRCRYRRVCKPELV